MYMMAISYWMWMLLLTSLTGTVFTIIWYLSGRIFEKVGFFNIEYTFLRLVTLFWVIPVYFLVFTNHNEENGNLWMVPNSYMVLAAIVVCVVWLVGVEFFIVQFVRKRKREQLMRRCAVPCETACYLEQFEKACKELHISGRRPRLMESCDAEGPCVVGLFRPMIILPEYPIDPRYLQVIFIHELVHYRQKDLWLKCWVKFLTLFHFFNPAAWWLKSLVERWSEYACDYCAAPLAGGGKEYFQSILDLATGKCFVTSQLSLHLFRKKEELLDRVEHMKKIYGRKRKPRFVAALLTVAMTLASSGTAFATSAGTSQLYNQVWRMTENQTVESLDEETEEWTEFEDNEDPEGITIMQAPANTLGVSTYSSVRGFTWSVTDEYILFSDGFTTSKGCYIQVMANATPADKYIYLGIIEPDGNRRCIYAKGQMYHKFTVRMSGMHRIYAKNTSGKTVKVTGSYIW